MDWNMRKVVVTGGTGFLGSKLVERLRKLGARVAIPTRPNWDFLEEFFLERKGKK